ncbi:twin-arginine translocase TatA/TatE family subunit [Lichenihabitans sp. Uapishka_5]|uniref:twin-arginine translocase TatA/TatE family subunit n=1 Tax=Lichenihabitans sp. Uapishka_5 TaxID=3037302 RepID=UPI0029E7E188|nr:twin-arginine translocase TatA/TatE family subunit [Lichenihabitans sp. Uapishka_5]MDX7950362.1 twin-arginine translocase TatA/TatE family subunit [Lichenihabitans sp. Uapishka_5]
MGGMSMWHWIIVGGILLLLFGGKGKVSDIMGDFAKGIKSFKKGMADDDVAEAPRVTPVDTTRPADPLRTIDHRTAPVDAPVDSRRVG